jgi:protein-S-isoprenylcysteine O-methyltransferase Ste14
MGRMIGLLYWVLAYILFFLTFLYSMGFVGNLLVPKSIDSGGDGSAVISLVINLVLLSVFAVQHTVMARPKFKELWTKIIPKPVERSTYVLLSSLALILLFTFWKPMSGAVWNFDGTAFGIVLQALFWAGWLIVLTSTFMIDHFDLFGLRQVYLNLKQQKFNHRGFQTSLFYKLVRHPIMSGFIIAFWATPTMTVGHLLFAVVTTIYIYIAVKHFEEKDLVKFIGPDYVAYQQDVGMFVPGLGKKKS